MRNFILITCSIILLINVARAQYGSVRGFVYDAKTHEPLEGVLVVARQKVQVQGIAYTDAKGFYDIKALPHDTYSLLFKLIEYQDVMVENILVQVDMVIFVRPIQMPKHLKHELQAVCIMATRSPLRMGEIGIHISGSASGLNKSSGSNNNRYTSGVKNKAYVSERDKTSTAFLNRRKIIDEEKPANEEYTTINENPFLPTHKNLLSTFSIDVDKASYSNMRRYLQQNNLPPKDVIRTEELLNYFSYNYPQPTDDKPFSIITEMADCPWNKNHKLVHIGIQGRIIPMENIPAMNLVFLVDISGSMQTPDKLPLVIESLKLLTAQLRSRDKICIVTYAGGDAVALAPTSGADKVKIYYALQNLKGGGGTNGSAGIKRAYEEALKSFITNGNNRVILCTDGDFNLGVSNEDELQKIIEEERKSGVYLSVLGFGMGNYKDNRMEMLADKGNGNYAYIDKMDEAKKVFVHEIGGTLFTIANDVKIQMEFNPMYVKEYRLIGYENRKLNNEDFTNDAIDAGDLGSGHNVTALYELVPNIDKSDQGALKYDASDITPSKLEGNEWLFVKMRYKDPGASASKLIIHKLDNTMTNNPTSNFYFSAAVAEFAMLMRNSNYKGGSSFAEVTSMATSNAGNDSLGYKREFVDLVKKAEQLSGIAKR